MTMIPGSRKVRIASNSPDRKAYDEAVKVVDDLILVGKTGYILAVTFDERDSKGESNATVVFSSNEMSPTAVIDSVADTMANVFDMAKSRGLLNK